MEDVNTKNAVIYDLSKAPITFDFVNFLAFARLAVALGSGDPKFYLTILADSWRVSSPRERQYNLTDRLWRLHNLIVPVCSVTQGMVGYTLVQDARARNEINAQGVTVRSEGGLYMMSALVEVFHMSGFDPHLFKAPEMALDFARIILGQEEKAVVVAVRESSFDPGRNTPPHFLRELILKLQESGLAVYLIPDQEVKHNMVDLPNAVTVVEEAAFNIPLRLALHELAQVSILSGSGPSNFISLSTRKPNLVIIHPMRPEIRISSPEFLSQQGYIIGEPQPLPWIPANQIWLWDPLVSAQEVCSATQTLID